MAKPDQSSFPEQHAFQPAVMATMAAHVMPSPTSKVLSPVTTSPGAPFMLAATSQQGFVIPEPASLDLLGFCVLGIVAARKLGGGALAGTHGYPRRVAARQAARQSPISSRRKVRSGP